MHHPIKEYLEDILNGTAGSRSEVKAHLSNCHGCREELQRMELHSRLFQSLRAPADIEAGPGLYARVLDRIESQTKSSIWNVFLESPFGKRIAYASVTLAMLLGSYMVSTEPGGQPASSLAEVAISEQQPVPDFAVAEDDRQQTRDAVLANLASYHQ